MRNPEVGIFWTALAGRAVKETRGGLLKKPLRYKVVRMLEAETKKKEEKK